MPVFSTGRIEVIRGPQSSLYGSEAIGGVVDITSPIPDEGTVARMSMAQGSHKTTKLNSYFGFNTGEHFGSVAMNQIQSKGISAKSDNTEADGLRQTSAHLKFGAQISEALDISATTLLLNFDGDYDGCGSNDCRAKYDKKAIGIEMNYKQPDSGLVHKVKLFNTHHKKYDFTYGPNRGKKSKIEYQALIDWDARDTDQTTILALNTEKNEASWSAERKGRKFKTKSMVLEQRVDFGNDLFASLSARYDDNTDNHFKDYKTYRGTMAWVVNEKLRLHSSAGTGVKNPTVYELYGFRGDWVANPDLKPETSKSWDLGAEFRPNLADLTVDLTYFNNKVTNLIDPKCAENCFGQPGYVQGQPSISKSINNPGVSTIKGWELSVLGRLADTYDVTASATFLKGFDSVGKELVRRPSQILSLNISREFTQFGRSGSFNLNIQHVGNQSDSDYPPPTYQRIAVELPKYTLVNLGATLNLKSNLELTGKIDNLFDEKYSEVYGYNKPGRTIQVGLQYTF